MRLSQVMRPQQSFLDQETARVAAEYGHEKEPTAGQRAPPLECMAVIDCVEKHLVKITLR